MSLKPALLISASVLSAGCGIEQIRQLAPQHFLYLRPDPQ